MRNNSGILSADNDDSPSNDVRILDTSKQGVPRTLPQARRDPAKRHHPGF